MSMRIYQKLILLCGISSMLFTSCSKDPDDVPHPKVSGCTDPQSLNYNSQAEIDDGSCQYPEKYFPLHVGDYWRLTDNIMIPIIGTEVTVTQEIQVTGDSTYLGKEYKLVTEDLSVATFGTLQSTSYLYRQANTGEVYRITEGDTIEKMFLDYPMEPGDTWYSNENQDEIRYQLISYNYLLTVPAGTFSDAIGIEVTDLQNSVTNVIYVAKDFGMLRNTLDITFFGFEFNIDAELDSLSISME